jgi:hypothetical protein
MMDQSEPAKKFSEYTPRVIDELVKRVCDLDTVWKNQEDAELFAVRFWYDMRKLGHHMKMKPAFTLYQRFCKEEIQDRDDEDLIITGREYWKKYLRNENVQIPFRTFKENMVTIEQVRKEAFDVLEISNLYEPIKQRERKHKPDAKVKTYKRIKRKHERLKELEEECQSVLSNLSPKRSRVLTSASSSSSSSSLASNETLDTMFSSEDIPQSDYEDNDEDMEDQQLTDDEELNKLLFGTIPPMPPTTDPEIESIPDNILQKIQDKLERLEQFCNMQMKCMRRPQYPPAPPPPQFYQQNYPQNYPQGYPQHPYPPQYPYPPPQNH